MVLHPSCAYVSGPIGGFKRAAFYLGPLSNATNGSLADCRIEAGLGECVEEESTSRMLPVQLAVLPCMGVRCVWLNL
jgi:hypothetical protein